ncbi:hypothetical protein ACHAW6_003339 [Cyclotella cf. meneghiniana]
MGIKQDTKDSLKDFEFTKIDGQPTNEDLNQLTKECINAAFSISTTNGGGQHGHAGMIIPRAEYIQFSHNAKEFIVPTKPGPSPAHVDADAVIHEQQVAKHKAEQAEFETYKGVQNFLHKAIIKSVDPEWMAELESKTTGFNHRTPMEILTHLRDLGIDLNHLNVTELIQKLQMKAGQAANPQLRVAFELATFEASGEFKPSFRKWKGKDPADQTFPNFCVFMQKAFIDRMKHNKSSAKSAGRGIANHATDQTMDKVN